MRREPGLTFQGALAILGHREHRAIKRLDKLLGGIILAAGAGAGMAAAGPAALAPLGIIGAVWGWLEQRDEALRLLQATIDSVSEKLGGTEACERQQLIAAAHTTIVVAAFFEALQDSIGGKRFSRKLIAAQDREKAGLGRPRRQEESLYEFLYSSEVPAPRPACGFEENCPLVGEYMKKISGNLREMLDTLPVIEEGDAGLLTSPQGAAAGIPWRFVEERALLRYKSRYLDLASAVPEFAIWAMLGEHSATRWSVDELRADMTEALSSNRDALGRLEALLTLDRAASAAGMRGEASGPRAVLARANGGRLADRIIPEDADVYGPDITFPTIQEIYVNHRYRLTRYAGTAFRGMRLSDESWWAEQPTRGDFDLLLAGYVTSLDATRVPMLLLGHPGAGKSMLMKVLAARLPPDRYTVIRVPLRRVDCDAPLVNQVQQALDLATNRRVELWQLADQSRGFMRVVLLDGLDEMLQGSQHDRRGYLQEIAEFQRVEAEQERPVVVIVTSRTVVADRVNIPIGVTIAKLDPFNEEDIGTWLDRWHRANAAAIAADRVRELTPGAVRRQAHLAEQPLLLLMLAIYAADPSLPSLDGDLLATQLYQRILEEFTRREAAKDTRPGMSDGELDQRTRDHLERLAVAALAMFNRGQLCIDEESLGRDLAVLDPGLMTRTRPAEDGERIIREFFFVHAPETRTLTGEAVDAGQSVDGSRPGHSRRAYEFLHATFGEYLVARRAADELVDLVERAFAGNRGRLRVPDDDLLFTLLSHQALAARPATLAFAEEIMAGLPDTDSERLRSLLGILLSNYRHRHRTDLYASYQPVPQDHVRQLACYSANLVVMRAALEKRPARIALTSLLGVPDSEALLYWQSTVRLWQAGLDLNGFQTMISMLQLASEPDGIILGLYHTRESQGAAADIALCRLVRDTHVERRLRYGAAVTEGYAYSNDGSSWYDTMASSLISISIGKETRLAPEAPPAGTTDEEIASIASLIFCCLRSDLCGPGHDEKLIRLLSNLPDEYRNDPLALAGAVLRNPGLPVEFPELQQPEVFGQYAGIVASVRSTILPKDMDLKNPGKETVVTVRNILTKKPATRAGASK
jgi:hypothetical protein